MKIRPVGVELFYADGQTQMTKLKSLFAMLREHQKFVHLSEHLLNTSNYTAVYGKENSAADI
jgi:hypothetical protein